MIESIEWLRVFIFNYRSLEYIIILLSTAIGGELALFALGFLVAQGILPLFPSVIISFLGAFAPNILWFLLGNTDIVNKIISHRYASTTISTIVQTIVRISKGNHFVALIITKFLVGTPPILVMYINKADLKFKQFLYYETPAVILSLLVIIPTGFISGLGFIYLADIFHNLYVAIGFILSVIIIIMAVQLWFKKVFINILK
ncbi:hypothetical protein A2814_03205 [Candidatus Nomurabacteria bacterium RIFCSPHIGHO2_01_FULL_38_19]|uniref:TVP38/TMEM64 family membrane protein n=1 Tax=Candidatus Nomurabacteria bacterium RIFCSPHIGHO2_01_FULL_38_19 TaxID=1801732 RepID=A0A1F6UQ71_9BACT|nr:MAG: hypothetical protein A2814_03205 [Candidatus Nomurabacteria bacterium RIFCSPHIGHO2_01_FULL_38_19]